MEENDPMSSTDRKKVRADRAHDGGRRRGPTILRFESLEGRQLLAASAKPADLVAVNLQTEANRDWGDPVRIQGGIQNNGGTKVDSPFKVDVYVSPTKTLGSQSVKIGSFEISDSIKPGQDLLIDESVDLPGSAIAGVGSDQAIYIGLVVDPEIKVGESNETNNYNRGLGADTALILVTPRMPSQLEAKSLTVDQSSVNWGDDVTVIMRIENVEAGAAPATRARLVLTPAGETPGGSKDVTVADDIEVPALGAYSSTQLTKQITLPPGPPTGAASNGTAKLWLDTDADYLTNPLYAGVLLKQAGVDYAQLAITPSGTGTTTPVNSPDVATSDVLTPGTPLVWGQPFQVAATIHNLGDTDSGPLRIRYLLGGPNGETSSALVLGDTTIDSLKAGASQSVVRELKLPSKLPFGVQLTAGTGRVIVVVDPENTGLEPVETNNSAQSGVVTLKLPGTNTPSDPVPTTPTPTTPKPTPTPAQRAANQVARQQRAQKAAERRLQLQALRQSLQQQRATQAAAQRARRRASSADTNLTLFP
jgi:CARDB